MKNFQITAFLFLISFSSAMAQDWQCVYEGVTATFVDTMKNFNEYRKGNTMWAVSIDSVRVKEGWNYHYGYVQPRVISSGYINGTPNYTYCYEAFAPSRMGIALSAREGENFYFNSAGYGIRISTLK